MCAQYSMAAQDHIYIIASNNFEACNKPIKVLFDLRLIKFPSHLSPALFCPEKPSVGPAGEVLQVTR